MKNVPNWKDFAPRFGIAYRFNDKTVFRGGFGISYAPFPDNQYGWNNFPITQNNSYNPNNSYGPAVYANGQVAQLSVGFPAPTLAVKRVSEPGFTQGFVTPRHTSGSSRATPAPSVT